MPVSYRLYVESLFEEFSTEIKLLFDRRDAASVLWPKRQTFEGLLAILNTPELSGVWGEDETIGWVYQFFNSGEERKKMRDESQAPRNSRELAVRNQFFTPRYVVQFLVDNTLGRLWLEMHGGQTGLIKLCEYLVRSADEPAQSRERKDPRDLRVLDPACGSGHFLLYSFDLLLAIYEEAWLAEGPAPRSEATGCSLREDYPDLPELRRAAPRLIVEFNLHGVDIDPRCAQIAALALWLRAQRAWKGEPYWPPQADAARLSLRRAGRQRPRLARRQLRRQALWRGPRRHPARGVLRSVGRQIAHECAMALSRKARRSARRTVTHPRRTLLFQIFRTGSDMPDKAWGPALYST
jgi:hypothetical protein